MEVTNPQWNALVDITNVSLMHDLHDVSINRPDIEANLTVGEEGFTLEVIPTRDTPMVTASEVNQSNL